MSEYGIDDRFYDKQDTGFALRQSANVENFNASYYVEDGFDPSETSVYFVCRVLMPLSVEKGSHGNRWTKARKEFESAQAQIARYREAHRSFKDIKDVYVLRVGSIDFHTVRHAGATNNGLTYAELYHDLIHVCEYDPLQPIRSDSVRKHVEHELTEIIKKAFEAGRSQGYINAAVGKYASGLVDKVKDYILGGNKPRLDPETVRRRKYKENNGLADYPSGINEPLAETGELAESISYTLIKEQSDSMKAIVDDYRKNLEDWQRRARRTQLDQKRNERIRKSRVSARYDPNRVYNMVWERIMGTAGLVLRGFKKTYGEDSTRFATRAERVAALDRIESDYAALSKSLPAGDARLSALKTIIDYRRAVLSDIGRLEK